MLSKGFVQIVVLIVIVLIIASLLGVDLRTFFQSEDFQKNYAFAKDVAVIAWTEYFKPAFVYVWEKVASLFDRGEEEPELSALF